MKACSNCNLVHEIEADCLVQLGRQGDRAEWWMNFAFQCMTAFLIFLAAGSAMYVHLHP